MGRGECQGKDGVREGTTSTQDLLKSHMETCYCVCGYMYTYVVHIYMYVCGMCIYTCMHIYLFKFICIY